MTGLSGSNNHRLFIFMFLVLFGSACGYHIVGNENRNKSDGTRSIYLHVLANQTEEPLLEKRLSSLISRELLTDHRIRLVNHIEDAQAHLQGEIVSFGETAVSFDALQRTLEYRVHLTLNINLSSSENQAILWERNGIQATAEYLSTSDTSATRVAKDRAIHEIGKIIGETILFNLFNQENHPEGEKQHLPL